MSQTTSMLKEATRDGVKLCYVDAGAGDPAIVFIHGWCCNNTYWRDQLPVFAKDHRVVSVDLRGHGQSEKPEQDYTMPGFVDDAAWLIRELGSDHPVVVGHSMGGVIALGLAQNHPDMTRGVVIVDSPILPFGPEFAPMRDQVLGGLRSPAYKETATTFVNDFLFREDSPAALREEIVRGMTSAPQHVMASALENTMNEANIHRGAVPVPALFVAAATFPFTAHQLGETYPGMQVEAVDCAHFVQMEQPARFNTILSQFLGKLR